MAVHGVGDIRLTGRWGGDSGVVILGKSDVVINDILIGAVSKEFNNYYNISVSIPSVVQTADRVYSIRRADGRRTVA